ncbi:MAG: fibrobacter succinogenes major paralogous domain-containing protein [Bacteroidales bacterium]|jgi:uncharacterized protein (TIGR02145 family)|nr:fibrobacter succinogenes major paralogous domain-containing protein [Bacteroidales bacterium]
MKKIAEIFALCCIALNAQAQTITNEKELQQRQAQIKQQLQDESQGKHKFGQSCSQKGGAYVNSVCWATRNVSLPGTFADRPESAGMFYQWNSAVGWTSTDPLLNSNSATKWNTIMPDNSEWKGVNNPCPQGWRVPTQGELKSLLDDTKVQNEWTTQNTVNGRKFTDKASRASIFFPAAGSRNWKDGSLKDVGDFGCYWSSEQHNGLFSYYLYFFNKETHVSNFSRSAAQSVRCVAE